MGSPAQFPNAAAALGSVSLSAGTAVIGKVRLVDGSDNQNASGFPLFAQLTAGTAAIGTAKVAGANGNANDNSNPLFATLLPASKTNLQVGGVDVSNSVPVPINDAGGSVTIDFDNAVGGKAIKPSVTVSTSAYSANFVMGGKLTLTGIGRANSRPPRLTGVKLDTDTVQTQTFLVYLFSSDPSNSTFTDRATFTLASADRAKVMGVVRLNDIIADGGGSVHQALDLNRVLDLGAATAAYAVIVTTGAATFGASTDVTVEFQVEQG